MWDVLTPEQAHALVLQHADAEPLTSVAQRIVQAAQSAGSRDNISALVLDLRECA